MFRQTADFLSSYDDLLELLDTPSEFPVPLVRLTRALLVLWLATLPFVLLAYYDSGWVACGAAAALTYGFLELEYVTAELEKYGSVVSDSDDGSNTIRDCAEVRAA